MEAGLDFYFIPLLRADLGEGWGMRIWSMD
jgi:hypothetical protein